MVCGSKDHQKPLNEREKPDIREPRGPSVPPQQAASIGLLWSNIKIVQTRRISLHKLSLHSPAVSWDQDRVRLQQHLFIEAWSLGWICAWEENWGTDGIIASCFKGVLCTQKLRKYQHSRVLLGWASLGSLKVLGTTPRTRETEDKEYQKRTIDPKPTLYIFQGHSGLSFPFCRIKLSWQLN